MRINRESCQSNEQLQKPGKEPICLPPVRFLDSVLRYGNICSKSGRDPGKLLFSDPLSHENERFFNAMHSAAKANVRMTRSSMKTSENTACQRALEYGIDLSVIRENLRLSVMERLQRHQAALNMGIELQRAIRSEQKRHWGD